MTPAKKHKQDKPASVAPAKSYRDALKKAKEVEEKVRAEKSAEKESKLLFVLTPKPWIDDALPFSTTVREAALVYRRQFETTMHYDFHDGVRYVRQKVYSFEIKVILTHSYCMFRSLSEVSMSALR
jgi:hypothetical protein